MKGAPDMKILTATALVAAQLASALPAHAADLVGGAEPAQGRMGAFAGTRLRVELGGRHDGRARFGLTLAPISQSQAMDGRSIRRFGEGFELGIAGREPARLRLAGYRVGPGGTLLEERDARLGLSTIETAAVAGGVIVVGLLALALIGRNDSDD